MSKPIRVAVVGLGFPGQKHTQNLSHLPNVEIVGFADFTERAGEYAKQYGGNAYRDWQALLQNEPDLDALVLATPPTVRTEALLACFERNISVFCEKPPAVSVQAAQPVLRVLKEKPHLVSVGFQYRWNPLALKIREIIAGKTILFARIMVAWPVFDWVKEGNASPNLYWKAKAGGPLVEQGIHFQDILRFITGDEPREVFARADVGRLHEEERDAEETTLLTIRHASGMLSNHIHNWSHRGMRLELQLIGDDWDLTWDMANNKVQGRMDEKSINLFTEADPYLREMEGFLSAIQALRAGDNPMSHVHSSFPDSVRSLAVVEAAARSVISGQVEFVNSL